MRWAIATGLILVVAAAGVGCGGTGGDSSTGPATGVPLAHGKCKSEPSAQRQREADVKSGTVSARAAQIAEFTEIHACEIERGKAALKSELCDHDPVDLLREGKISERQAGELQDLQKKANC
jgi:hypothetical protein